MRFLLYSHDGLGLGHVRRNLAIASALVRLDPDAQILVATSVDEVSRLGLPRGVDTLKLPGLRKIDNRQYVPRRLGLRTLEMWRLRSSLLLAAIHGYRPDVILVDKHPLGVARELEEGLLAAKAAGARLVLGLRDILDEPGAVLREWVGEGLHEIMTRLYDRILIYGERRIFDPIQQYCFTSELAERTEFCGYVLNHSQPVSLPSSGADPRLSRTYPVVLATAGGGEDGFELLRTFMEAASGASWAGIAVTGPMMGDKELQLLRVSAAANWVALHTFVQDLPALLRRVDALVSMGGYNTLTEAMATGLPLVCVPRIRPRSEQLIRARSFADLGLLRVLRPEQLYPEKLRREIDGVLTTPRGRGQLPRPELNLDGADRAARYLLAAKRRNATPANFTTAPLPA